MYERISCLRSDPKTQALNVSEARFFLFDNVSMLWCYCHLLQPVYKLRYVKKLMYIQRATKVKNFLIHCLFTFPTTIRHNLSEVNLVSSIFYTLQKSEKIHLTSFKTPILLEHTLRTFSTCFFKCLSKVIPRNLVLRTLLSLQPSRYIIVIVLSYFLVCMHVPRLYIRFVCLFLFLCFFVFTFKGNLLALIQLETSLISLFICLTKNRHNLMKIKYFSVICTQNCVEKT